MNTKNETISRAGEREYNFGKSISIRTSVTRKVQNATASQRIQRGANRPLGKSKKNSTAQTLPTIFTPRTGNRQAGWEEIKASAFVVSTATGPKDTRNAETRSAMRSSERRQKMSAPTANHTSWKTLSRTTFRSA